MIGSAINTAIKGMEASLDSASGNATKIAQFGRNGGDLVSGMVGLKLDAMQFKASADVVKADNEMHRALLDILA